MPLPPATMGETYLSQPLFYNAGGWSGDQLSPLLNRDLNSDDLNTRQNALLALCQAMHNPNHISEAIQIGIVKSLTTLLKSPNVMVRERTTEVLKVIAGHAVGRQALIDEQTIMPLAELLEDGARLVRENSHTAFHMLTSGPEGANAVVDSGLVSVFVRRLAQEDDAIKLIVLKTLNNCIKCNPTPALSCNTMVSLVGLLRHQDDDIREQAAVDVMSLSFPFEGKARAVQANAIAALAKLLKDSSVQVRTAAAGAIMAITLQKEGKIQTLDAAGAIDALKLLLSDDEKRLRLNVIKVMTNVGEHPAGRAILKDQVPMLKLMCDSGDPMDIETRSAAIAYKVLTWRP